MGLFDNLFLDKNTPMAINNGEEHPVVTQNPPQTQQSSMDTKKTEQAISKAETAIGKADTVADLFAPEKPKASQQDVQVIPTDDIQFSPQISATQSTPASSDVSFDIGGDMSFDIGGDIGLAAPTEVTAVTPVTGTDATIESIQTPSSIIENETPQANGNPGGIDVSHSSSDVSTTTPVDNSTKIETSSPSINMGTENPADSALFSLLNESVAESVTESAIQDKTQEVAIEQESTIIPVNDSMQSLLTNDELMPQIHESEAVNATTPSVEPIIANEIPQVNNQIIMSDTTHDIAPIDVHSGITFHSIEEMPGLDHASSMGESSIGVHGNAESKFNAKIKGFIEELRSLEVEDQKERDEKLNQAALFRSHAKSLREEAEVRARALEDEAEDLVKQADSIAADKAHINSVISNFREKFEVA